MDELTGTAKKHSTAISFVISRCKSKDSNGNRFEEEVKITFETDIDDVCIYGKEGTLVSFDGRVLHDVIKALKTIKKYRPPVWTIDWNRPKPILFAPDENDTRKDQ